MQFSEIWFVDFEYFAPAGELPKPLCLVARELYSRRLVRLLRRDFSRKPPCSTSSDSLFVSYAANAELSCYFVLVGLSPRMSSIFMRST